MYKTSDKIINPIKKAIENWKVESAAGEETRAEVKIQRGIFKEVILAIAICYSADATQIYIYKMHWVGGLQILKITGKGKPTYPQWQDICQKRKSSRNRHANDKTRQSIYKNLGWNNVACW